MTNTTRGVETPVLLKSDTRGRVRTPAGRRERLLDEFERSGLSGQKFAELTGLKYQTFATWVQQRRRRNGQATAPSKVPKDPGATVRWLDGGGRGSDGCKRGDFGFSTRIQPHWHHNATNREASQSGNACSVQATIPLTMLPETSVSRKSRP